MSALRTGELSIGVCDIEKQDARGQVERIDIRRWPRAFSLILAGCPEAKQTLDRLDQHAAPAVSAPMR